MLDHYPNKMLAAPPVSKDVDPIRSCACGAKGKVVVSYEGCKAVMRIEGCVCRRNPSPSEGRW